ncbi:hypothetical protein LOTGIDRAFT_234571 [Lottia gigantea]|uniref:Uncharacterized protein n=1 Tax=Lottia gigantea TaxID=225164 RepID=V3ZZY5_LOTGI|nr:hypothetical protein LOTGIDRAFT_234571 [Lottia gigantea]ESO88235.1 hypothetical protein LOTGIDRAFT_234571 [Lottia gigantea]
MNIVVGTYEELILGYKLINSEETYKIEQTFTDHSHLGCIKSAGISRKNVLATGSTDETIRLFNLQKQTELGTLMHHSGNVSKGTVTQITFHQDSHMFSTSEDGTMCVWKNYSWECLRQFRGHKGAVNSVSVHPSGKLAITVSKDKTLRTWNLITGRHAYISNIKEIADNVLWSPDGNHYAVSIYNKIHIYKMEDAAIHCTIESEKRINNIVFINNNVISYGGEGGQVFLHDFTTDKQVTSLQLKCTRIKGLCCSYFDDNIPLLIIAASDGNIWVFKIQIDQEQYEKVVEHDTKFRITCLAVTPPLPTKKHMKSEETLVLEQIEDNTNDKDNSDEKEDPDSEDSDSDEPEQRPENHKTIKRKLTEKNDVNPEASVNVKQKIK